jgi:hypothetical protein
VQHSTKVALHTFRVYNIVMLTIQQYVILKYYLTIVKGSFKMKIFTARIIWLTLDLGGREILPKGDKYAPIVKLKNQDFGSEYWGLFVKNVEIINSTETLAEVRYLSLLAPDNLYIGIEFELFEGKRHVANGTIMNIKENS